MFGIGRINSRFRALRMNRVRGLLRLFYELAEFDEASQSFQSLPSAIRQTFENDPQKFLEFVEDLDNVGSVTDQVNAPSGR